MKSWDAAVSEDGDIIEIESETFSWLDKLITLAVMNLATLALAVVTVILAVKS